MAEINFQDLYIAQEENQDKIPNDSPVGDRFSTSVEITFYCNRAEPNRIDKTNYLFDEDGNTNYRQIEGTFKSDIDLINLSIDITGLNSIIGHNYLSFIYDNKVRYYFISNITIIRRNVIQIDCVLDVLMTYKDAILDCYAFIERNEYKYDSYIDDDERTITEGYKTVNQIEIEVPFFVDSVEDYTELGYGTYVINGIGIESEAIPK